MEQTKKIKCSICHKKHIKKFPVTLFLNKDRSNKIVVGSICLSNALNKNCLNMEYAYFIKGKLLSPSYYKNSEVTK